MARVIALASTMPHRLARLELLRALIVCGCALALIAAGQALPAPSF